jgi:secondary thiamine-phosphate synthase enzyme
MRQAQTKLAVRTTGAGLYPITQEVAAWLVRQDLATGLLTVFVRHTSASLLIQENADPDVQRDLVAFFRRLVPDGDPLFVHTAEGPEDMPAHVKGALTQTSLGIPVADGRLAFGTWQGVYLFEHRHAPHRREVLLHLVGE